MAIAIMKQKNQEQEIAVTYNHISHVICGKELVRKEKEIWKY